MTYVTCRCGNGFETQATCGRTSCPSCKGAVTVPKPGSARFEADRTEEHASSGSGRVVVALLGVAGVASGAITLQRRQKSAPPQQQRSMLAWGTAELVAGAGLLYAASRSEWWSDQ